MTFELASLQLATAFDRPGAPLRVPGTAARGDDPSLALLDGASRGAHRLARLVRQEALLGLEVGPTHGPLRVTVTLLVDDHATRLWRLARRLKQHEHPHETAWHRLVRVSVQGRPRAAVVLDRRARDLDGCLQRVVLEVEPHELGPGGMLVLGLDVPEHVPDGLRAGLLEDGLTGVCVARVKVEQLGRPVRAGISTGRVPDRRRSLVPRRPGGFAVTPGRQDRQPLRVILLPRALQPRTSPAGVVAGAKEPLARLRDRVSARGALRREEVLTEVVRLDTGASRTVRSTVRPDGSAVLELDPADGPVLCHPSSGSVLGDDWFVWVEDGR